MTRVNHADSAKSRQKMNLHGYRYASANRFDSLSMTYAKMSGNFRLASQAYRWRSEKFARAPARHLAIRRRASRGRPLQSQQSGYVSPSRVRASSGIAVL